MGIFKRNLTSKILEKETTSILASLKEPIHVLEIGCGDGNISKNLAYLFPENFYHASDISEESILKAKLLDLDKKINFKISSGLDVWKGQKFSLIICDIASINQEIAELSEWYGGVNCETGPSGLELIIPIIKEVKQFLNVKGSFIIPVISLSNTTKQEEALNNIFKKVTYSKKVYWPLPQDLIEKMKENQISFNSKNIQTKNKFDLIIASTYSATCR